MTAPTDRVIPLPSPALPVPRGTVAVLRLPISGGGLDALNLALVEAYPDGFVFAGSRTKQYLQIGNAVPPLLARAILETIVDGKVG